jgi:hypothetical protein
MFLPQASSFFPASFSVLVVSLFFSLFLARFLFHSIDSSVPVSIFDLAEYDSALSTLSQTYDFSESLKPLSLAPRC